MNELLTSWGWLGLKFALTVAILPPVPFLLLALAGARLMFHRRWLGWLLMLVSVLGLWFSQTTVLARALMPWLLSPPPALSAAAVKELERAPRTAIVVLGGGRDPVAPEYGVSNLKPRTIERLRYGLWLGRQTGLPVAFSGGIGHGHESGPTEAEIAARVAERDFRQPLRWTEDQSRDTRENAALTVALLAPQNIDRIVLVTHAAHMPRALAHFEHTVAARGIKMTLRPAPMGWAPPRQLRAFDWIPTVEGHEQNWMILRESLGRLAGG
jgi:uncharacterized SAM-binding protein YcdF (DUF218 family)